MKRYYIGGKQYVPEESTELCSYADALEKSTLYATDKGAFFIVREGFMNGTTARVVSREDAFGYMDAHADGIQTENYNRFFGEPERG